MSNHIDPATIGENFQETYGSTTSCNQSQTWAMISLAESFDRIATALEKFVVMMEKYDNAD